MLYVYVYVYEYVYVYIYAYDVASVLAFEVPDVVRYGFVYV